MTSEAEAKDVLPKPRVSKCVLEDPQGQGHEDEDSITGKNGLMSYGTLLILASFKIYCSLVFQNLLLIHLQVHSRVHRTHLIKTDVCINYSTIFKAPELHILQKLN